MGPGGLHTRSATRSASAFLTRGNPLFESLHESVGGTVRKRLGPHVRRPVIRRRFEPLRASKGAVVRARSTASWSRARLARLLVDSPLRHGPHETDRNPHRLAEGTAASARRIEASRAAEARSHALHLATQPVGFNPAPDAVVQSSPGPSPPSRRARCAQFLHPSAADCSTPPGSIDSCMSQWPARSPLGDLIEYLARRCSSHCLEGRGLAGPHRGCTASTG
jgi:hypothetical protein